MLEGYFSNKRTNIFFERTIKRTFLSLYIVQFVCLINVLSNSIISKERLFERTKKIRKIWKNEIRKKKMNFEWTLFDQTTSSHVLGFLAANLRLSKFVVVVRELEVVATGVDVDGVA